MDICQLYYQKADEKKANSMSAYMRNQFPFLGLMRSDRKELDKEFLKTRKKDNEFDWTFVNYLTDLSHREFFYLALGYLYQNYKLIKKEDFGKVETLILKKSWWDSVDSIAPIVGSLCLIYPDLIDKYIHKWMDSDNFWLVRSSILFQLKYKQNTDIKLLSKVIIKHKEDSEFFIRKAIGWILREYSKTNPDWVKEFVMSEELSALSHREALKWITKKNLK